MDSGLADKWGRVIEYANTLNRVRILFKYNGNFYVTEFNTRWCEPYEIKFVDL
jgi:hypothetical protein